MALAMRSVPTGIRPSPSPRPAVLSRPPNVVSGSVAGLTGTSGTPALVGDGATAVATAQAVHHCARVPTVVFVSIVACLFPWCLYCTRASVATATHHGTSVLLLVLLKYFVVETLRFACLLCAGTLQARSRLR